mmetsp:Transcript_82951/g.258003  ORF Transcript_82951/g.258003 Transcript_82951/m.258003 type:complete len:201 (+) Transcript_82951:822-1424(+)
MWAVIRCLAIAGLDGPTATTAGAGAAVGKATSAGGPLDPAAAGTIAEGTPSQAATAGLAVAAWVASKSANATAADGANVKPWGLVRPPALAAVAATASTEAACACPLVLVPGVASAARPQWLALPGRPVRSCQRPRGRYVGGRVWLPCGRLPCSARPVPLPLVRRGKCIGWGRLRSCRYHETWGAPRCLQWVHDCGGQAG